MDFDHTYRSPCAGGTPRDRLSLAFGPETKRIAPRQPRELVDSPFGSENRGRGIGADYHPVSGKGGTQMRAHSQAVASHHHHEEHHPTDSGFGIVIRLVLVL